MTIYRPGDHYKITNYRVVDGDTIRATLTRETVMYQEAMPGWLHQHIVRSTTTDMVPIRLTILDTPERGEPGYRDATEMLFDWLDEHYEAGLSVELWTGGGFDRYLGDVYITGWRNRTASEYMLSQGWLPYLGAR